VWVSIIVCILYYYILHTIYIILFARHPSRVLRGSFSFPSVQLFVTISAAAVCGWRPFLENGIFFSLRLSLSFTRPCRLRFNTIIFILSHCFDDRKRARASRNPRTYTGIRHWLAEQTHARNTTELYHIIYRYIGK